MVEDRTELNDLSASNRSQADKMVAMWEAWAARCGVLPWDQLLAQRR
jgi:arylsulfatase